MQFSTITLSLPFLLAMMVSSISASPISEEKREISGAEGGDLLLRSSNVELNTRGAKVDYGYMVAAIIGAFNAIRSRDLQDDVEARGLDDYDSLISRALEEHSLVLSKRLNAAGVGATIFAATTIYNGLKKNFGKEAAEELISNPDFVSKLAMASRDVSSHPDLDLLGL